MMRLNCICFLLIFSLFICYPVYSQPVAGTTGLLNIPTAEMQTDGTFFTGVNYLPQAVTPDFFNYNTGNYYFNITFLPFLEVCYKLTLLKVNNNKFNQDRSVMVRGRLFKEGKYHPSLVFGINDIYSTGSENQYFNKGYWVFTKNIKSSHLNVSLSAGQQANPKNITFAKGYFGGVSLSPTGLDWLHLMAEYDSRNFNTGASLLLFKHLKLYAFAFDMQYLTGGIQYFVYL